MTTLEYLKRLIKREKLDQTKPVPNFPDLRYAGDDHKGYWPCLDDGTCLRTGDGGTLHFACMAHLREWAFEWTFKEHI